MKKIFIHGPQHAIHGTIQLEGSKSISNRLLLMQALCKEPFEIKNLSPSDDTQTLKKLIAGQSEIHDVGAAGTTMRFLISYYSILEGERILTGTERMKNRPVKILVDALRTIGAEISYLEKEGYPPLKIAGKKLNGGKLQIRADVSSQYISSLMMIAPVLDQGLELELQGKISSYPYIRMTLQTMAELGIRYEENGNLFKIYPGRYQPKTMVAESDWSAASYYFSIAALNKNAEIRIAGLFEKSLQGDCILTSLYKKFGVQSSFENGIWILKNTGVIEKQFEFDFSDCPDIAQTVAVTAATLGVEVVFTGVESLKIKETDRTQALSDELKKFGVDFFEDDGKWILKGETNTEEIISIRTYEDHRMAMCFAPLSLKHALIIEEPDVVNKSYPSFWGDLTSIGFSISSL